MRLDEQVHLRKLMEGKAPHVKFWGLPDCSNARDSYITNTEQIVCPQTELPTRNGSQVSLKKHQLHKRPNKSMSKSKNLGFQHTAHFLQETCSNRSLGEVGSAARSIQVTFHAESSAPLQAEGLGWICFHIPDNLRMVLGENFSQVPSDWSIYAFMRG